MYIIILYIYIIYIIDIIIYQVNHVRFLWMPSCANPINNSPLIPQQILHFFGQTGVPQKW